MEERDSIDAMLSKGRPWLTQDGSSMQRWDGRSKISEMDALLTKEQWIDVDQLTMHEFKKRSPITQYLLNKGLHYVVDKTTKSLKQEDLQAAVERMQKQGTVCELNAFSLPVTRKEFRIDQDQTNLTNASPLDSDQSTLLALVGCELAAGKVGESIDGMILGLVGYPGVNGFMNYPDQKWGEGDIKWGMETLALRHYCGPYTVIMNDEHALQIGDYYYKGQKVELIGSNLMKPGQWIVFSPLRSVIQMFVSLFPTVRQLDDRGNFQTLCIMFPQLRSPGFIVGGV